MTFTIDTDNNITALEAAPAAQDGLVGPAAFTGLAPGDVEFRQPAARGQQRVGERAALIYFFELKPERFAEGTAGRIPPELFQRLNQTDARRGKLRELVVKFRALRELAGREDQCHERPADGQAVARSRLAFKSRLLLAPTICSATWPFLKTSRVGMARTPNCAARPWCSSMFTLPILTLPWYSVASSSRTGGIILHGPHQSAHKSTRTGVMDCSASFSKLSCVKVVINGEAIN